MTTIPFDKNRQSVELPGTRRPGQTGLRTMPNSPVFGRRVYDNATKTFGGYVWETYTEVSDRITRFGSGLVHLHQNALGLPSVAQRWSAGIWAINRPEWTMASEACSAYNLVSVGLYDTLGPEAVIYGVNHSECPVVITSVDHVAMLLNDASKMPGLKIIISMDSLQSDIAGPGHAAAGSILRTYAQDKGVQLYDWAEVEAIGAQFGRKHTPAAPSDVYTICYTSGTTGNPKGAMITHGNIISVVAGVELNTPMTSDDCVISFLPLAHIFGRLMEVFMFSMGGKIGYSTGNQLLLLEDIAHLQPTIFPCVPRLLNRIYAKVYAATVEAPGLKGVLVKKALQTKLTNLKAGKGLTHPLWDRLIFSKVRLALGGNVRVILTASAPISPEILAFTRVAFCCEVIEAYGQTEGTGAATHTFTGETEAGHVGPPYSTCEVKLVDVPELDYFATDKPCPRGEICVRGPNIIKGYLKDDAKTKETIDEEGWLHSGDIGVMEANGTITVIDRKKNVFKLSQGEYIAAENIEARFLSRMPFVQQIFVHGDSLESFLVAIIVPEPEAFIPFASKVLRDVDIQPGDVETYQKICRDPKLRKAVLMEIFKAAKDAGMNGYEIPKAVMIETEAFSVENGKMTPTFKLKRHPVAQEYSEQLAALYREAHQADSKL
ncbi:hypothetical protein BGZ98_000209 [Dissophora globulifera]|nr:hypothetical protein BGZ98_000209 [Dissophora globulifera]